MNTFWQRYNGIIGPALVDQFSRVRQKETRNSFEDFILKNSNCNTKLLDAGCNTGVTGWRLFNKGYEGEYYGVDNNNKALSIAIQNLERSKSVFFQRDISSIPFPDKYFDIVLTKDVIEHCKDYETILIELARLTKKYLILSMFIKMSDLPDQINLQPNGFYMNRYNRKRLMDLMIKTLNMTYNIIFVEDKDKDKDKDGDEVIVFEKEI